MLQHLYVSLRHKTMKLIAKNDIVFGGKVYKAGNVFEVDAKTASFFTGLGWVEEQPEPEAPPKAKKKK